MPPSKGKIVCIRCRYLFQEGLERCPKCGTPNRRVIQDDSLVFTGNVPRNTIQDLGSMSLGVSEYKRTCRSCGKVWHSLISRENEIQKSIRNNALQGGSAALQQVGTCGMCGTSTLAQSTGNIDASESELSRLRSCPNCHSHGYDETVVQH